LQRESKVVMDVTYPEKLTADRQTIKTWSDVSALTSHEAHVHKRCAFQHSVVLSYYVKDQL